MNPVPSDAEKQEYIEAYAALESRLTVSLAHLEAHRSFIARRYGAPYDLLHKLEEENAALLDASDALRQKNFDLGSQVSELRAHLETLEEEESLWQLLRRLPGKIMATLRIGGHGEPT